jgi:hypothetical protein
MAAIDFPASPTVGQQFTPASGVTYQWNGTLWFPVATFPTASNVQATAGSNTTVGTAYTAAVNTGSIGASGQVWEILAHCMFCEVGGGAGGYYDIELWNGAAQIDHASCYLNVAGGQQNASLMAIATLTAATTFSLRGKGPTSFATILADARITAKRLA